MIPIEFVMSCYKFIDNRKFSYHSNNLRILIIIYKIEFIGQDYVFLLSRRRLHEFHLRDKSRWIHDFPARCSSTRWENAVISVHSCEKLVHLCATDA